MEEKSVNTTQKSLNNISNNTDKNQQNEPKEIQQGIFLQKQQYHSVGKLGEQLLTYVFKVQVLRLNSIEFTADFTGSENIVLENRHGLIAVTNIEPFQTEVVAKLILKKDWKIKSKFKLNLNPAPKEVQQEYLKNIIEELNQQMIKIQIQLQKYPISIMSISDVQSVLQQYNFKYIDSNFPPTYESIYGNDPNTIYKQLDTLIEWRRPSEFMEAKEDQGDIDIFYDSIDPTDIRIGEIDNINLYSALACLAERPALIERLFISKRYNLQGVYRIKICKNGEWVTVTLDDLIPCYPQSGPVFSKNHDNELWVLLIEKALAKLHGCYSSLQKISAQDALIDLTGCPCENIQFDEFQFQFQQDQQQIQQQQNNTALLQNNFKQSLWEKLIEAESEGYLLSVYEQKPLSLIKEEEIGQQFKQAGQVYTILQLRFVKDQQLICIRNPWGNFEWTGDWSKNSQKWTPEMKNLVNPILDDSDASFWINFDDFLKNFMGVYITKIKNWNEVRIKGKYLRVQDTEDINIEQVLSKWYYQMDILNQDTKVIIGIHQEDINIQYSKQIKENIDIGLIIYKKGKEGDIKNVKLSNYTLNRQKEVEVVLEEGSYIVLPLTGGCNIKKPEKINFISPNLKENIQGIEKLTPIAKVVINDIFKKFDILLLRQLGYAEFKGLFECIDRKISQKEFDQNILGKYQSSKNGVTLQGFQDFFLENILQLGEQVVLKWFKLLGYNNELKSIRSRSFMVTFHSDQELQINVKDAIHTDLNQRANIIHVSNEGQEISVEPTGVQLFYTYNSQIKQYSYAAINNQSYNVQVELDCSKTQNALFSTKTGTITKILGSEQLEFLMHMIQDPQVKDQKKSQKFIHNINFKWASIYDQEQQYQF